MNRDDRDRIWESKLRRVEQRMNVHLKHLERKVKNMDASERTRRDEQEWKGLTQWLIDAERDRRRYALLQAAAVISIKGDISARQAIERAKDLLDEMDRMERMETESFDGQP